MGDRASTPGSSGDELRGESDELDEPGVENLVGITQPGPAGRAAGVVGSVTMASPA
jgi:hypothetical protein